MLQKVISILIFISLPGYILSNVGLCGPSLTNNTLPSSAADCVPYSNSTDFCCYLNTTDAPSLYSACIFVESDNVFSVLNLGNMAYTVDCHGITDYYKYFPFEDEYVACGPQDPQDMGDCWKYNTNTSPCCLASTNDTFSSNLNLLCYLFPQNSAFQAMNYTEVNKYGQSIYFACQGNFLESFYFKIFSVVLLILFF